jgi:hypothetical protein
LNDPGLDNRPYIGEAFTGSADRMREWFRALLAGEYEWAPPEFLSKLRLLEGVLPFICRALGVKGVRSLLDLLPETDEQAGVALNMLHTWSGQILAGSPVGEAPGGTPGADKPEDGEA